MGISSDEIRRRCWKWLGHILRGDRYSNHVVALGEQLKAKRERRERPGGGQWNQREGRWDYKSDGVH